MIQDNLKVSPFGGDLEEAGAGAAQWQFFKYCTCGGTPKYKYHGYTDGRRNGLELHVLNVRKVFRLFENGKPKCGGALHEMKAILEQLHNE